MPILREARLPEPSTHAKALVSSEVVSRLATAYVVWSKLVAVESDVFPTRVPFIMHSVLIGIAAVKVAAEAAAAITSLFTVSMFCKNADS